MSEKGKEPWDTADDWDDTPAPENREKAADPFYESVAPDDDWDTPADTAPAWKPGGWRTASDPSGKRGRIIAAAVTVALLFFGAVLLGSTGPYGSGRLGGIVPVLTASPTPHITFTPTLRPTYTPTQRITPTPTPRPTPTPTPKPTDTPAPAPVSLLIENEWYGPELRYYYQQLNSREKKLFEELYNGIARCEKKISVSACTEREFERVAHVFFMDCPELFNYPGGGGTLHGDLDGNIIAYEPNYRIDKSTYDMLCIQIHQRIDQMKASFPSGAGDYEKEKVIHYWLADHCEYLAAGDDSTAFAEACLYYGRAQCWGYALANTLVLRSAGIQCLNVRSENLAHGWNIVKINGRWYQCDVTWDDKDMPWKPGGNRIAYWFNVPDRLVKDTDHIQKHEHGFTLPACSSVLDNYSYREGIYVQSGQQNVAKYLADSLKRAQAAGKYSVSILIEDASVCANWDQIQDKIWNEHKIYDWSIYPPHDNQTVFAVYKTD